MKGIDTLLTKANTLLREKRLLPGLEILEKLRAMTQLPERQLLLTFNIGVTYWDSIGDGINARREFLAAANLPLPASVDPSTRVLRANAIENLMLCALSFREFDSFTNKLEDLAPGMPIIGGLRPKIHEIANSGSGWSHAMFLLAMSNYNRNDPLLDRGRYGVAKSTYHLLLASHRELRLSREDWRLAIGEYCALALRMTGDCIKIRGGDNDTNSPDEFLVILTQAMPLVNEYVEAYPGDTEIMETRAGMKSLVEGFTKN